MRLRSGKRIGQSGQELTLAVFFSFFLHAAIVAAALFITLAVRPRISIPPYYAVKLVGLPADVPALPATPAPLLPPETPPAPVKQQSKAKMPSHKQAKTAPKKGRMPELLQHAPKKAQPEPTHEEQQAPQQQAAIPPAAAPAGKPGGKTAGVAVNPGSEDLKELGTYMQTMSMIIDRNWHPQLGTAGLKARVEFTINRSGVIVNNPELVEASGNFYFDQAAVRAIRQSNPFPPLPEDFYKQTATFSVDLIPAE